MKKSISIFLWFFSFFLLVFVLVYGFNKHTKAVAVSGKDFGENESPVESNRGVITIKDYDAKTSRPIKGAEFSIYNGDTNEMLETIITDVKGIAVSTFYNYGTSLKIKQTNILKPFGINGKEYSVQISEKNNVLAAANRVLQGRITIKNTDIRTKHGLKNTNFNLIDSKTNKVVETLTTNDKGIAVSKLYDYGTGFKIKQTKVMASFTTNGAVVSATIGNPNKDIPFVNRTLPFIQSYRFMANDTIDITNMNMVLKPLLQKPELPNGCEITSLTALLNYYHFNVSKTKMSDSYLPKQRFYSKKGVLFGPDPNLYFAGNPREKSGFFSYAPPIVSAANQYLKSVNGNYHGADLTGKKPDMILEELKKGNPVVTWITIGLTKPQFTYGWYLSNTNKYFKAPINLHAVVLTGYNGNTLNVMDPLRGNVTYDKNEFFTIYVSLGSRAMTVVKN